MANVETGIRSAPADFTLNGDDDVRTQVWGLLAASISHGQILERRRDQRYPYPHLVVLTPLEGDGDTLAGPHLSVAGKHLTERGLSFFHPSPLPYRRVIASLEANGGGWLAFVLDLGWCRFTRYGWYESGGRFLKVVTSPLEETSQ